MARKVESKGYGGPDHAELVRFGAYRVETDPELHFINGIVPNAESCISLEGLVTNKIKIKQILIQSAQALKYQLDFYGSKEYGDSDLAEDKFITSKTFDLSAYGGDPLQVNTLIKANSHEYAIGQANWNQSGYKLVRDSKGVYWTGVREALTGGGGGAWGTDGTFSLYRSVDGSTWERYVTVDQEYPPAPYPVQDYVLCVDSQDNIHIVYTVRTTGTPSSDYFTYYKKLDSSGRLSEKVTVTNGLGIAGKTNPSSMAILCDHNDIIHLVYTLFGAKRPSEVTLEEVLYRKLTNGVWTDEPGETLWTNLPDDSFRAQMVDIDIDSQGRIHVVFNCDGIYSASQNNTYNLAYMRQDYYLAPWATGGVVTGGSNYGFLRLTDLQFDSQYSPQIVIDADDVAHITWGGYGYGTYPFSSQLLYMTVTHGVPSAITQLTDVDYNQTMLDYGGGNGLTIDPTGMIHAVWSGEGFGNTPGKEQILYKSKPRGGSWGGTELLTNKAVDQIQQSMGSAKHPSSMRANGYLVMYFDEVGANNNDNRFIGYSLAGLGQFSMVLKDLDILYTDSDASNKLHFCVTNKSGTDKYYQSGFKIVIAYEPMA